MSAQTPIPQKRITAPEIMARKGGEPIVSLTSYHAHTAAIADPFVDFLLVGDSLGMVMHGYESTVPVPLELMIMHGRAVVRGAKRALVVIDMPFGSYEESPSVAFRNAAHIMKETGCGAIKLEGGRRMAETIRFLTERGIPVMGHIGLTPQSINVIGGFKTQGRLRNEWAAIEEDAKAVAEAGAFSIVLEAMAEELARKITCGSRAAPLLSSESHFAQSPSSPRPLPLPFPFPLLPRRSLSSSSSSCSSGGGATGGGAACRAGGACVGSDLTLPELRRYDRRYSSAT